MQSYEIKRGLEKITEIQNLETERNVLYNYSNSDHRYIVFDPNNKTEKGKGGIKGNVSLYCMFNTADCFCSRELTSKIARHMRSSEFEILIFDLETDTVFAPQPYEALPGKIVQDGILEYLKDSHITDENSKAALEKIITQNNKKEDPAHVDAGKAELEKLQADYLNLTVEDAYKKAKEQGLEMVISQKDGEWQKDAPRRHLYSNRPLTKWDIERGTTRKENRFAVWIFENKVVAIVHDHDYYSDSDDHGATLVFG